MPRTDFDSLPAEVRRAVRERTGSISSAATWGSGANSAIATLLETESGPVFVKGIPVDHSQVVTQDREAAINPYLPKSTPRLLWRVQEAGWDLLGFEFVDGRHASYLPGSPDVSAVLDAMVEVQALDAPDDVPVKLAEKRWATFAPAGTAHLFAGGTLLHTDWAPHNVLMDDGGARIIDWAWPTAGAAWIDPFMLALRLIEGGHTPDAALHVVTAHRLPSLRSAPRDAVEAFAAANTRSWREIATESPDVWKVDMAGHAAALEIELMMMPRR